MSARPIGEIVAPIIAEAVGLARLQEWLDTLSNPSPQNLKWWIMEWFESGTISEAEAEILLEHNNLEAA